MYKVGVLKTAVCLVLLLTVAWAIPTEVEGNKCELVGQNVHGKDIRVINVQCGDDDFEIELYENENVAQTTILGKDETELLQVIYDQTGDKHDMSIKIEGVEYNVKDDDSKEEEAAKFKDLLDKPAFKYFPEAVRLIHDELKLLGWESPSVMILYRLGVLSEHYKTVVLNKRWPWSKKVDEDTYKYHGSNPSKQCKKNGWFDKDMDHLIETKCRGICGPTCRSCWQLICGDCCMHENCQIHDDFCTSYLKLDCLTGRGVLWDKPRSKLKGC